MSRGGGLVCVGGVVGKRSCFGFGARELKNKVGVCCKGGWDSEGDLDLEEEILEFMKISENPDVFPSKKQLIAAGKVDLAEAIAKQGGWLSLGWDLDDEVQEEWEKVPGINDVTNWDLIMAMKLDNGSFRPEASSFSVDSSYSASSCGRSLETSGNDTGIEGILSRLEKERNINLGLNSREKGTIADLQNNGGKNGRFVGNPVDKTIDGIRWNNVPASVRSNQGIINHSKGSFDDENSLSHSFNAWRRWSIQNTSFLDENFEAVKIAFDETKTGSEIDTSRESENGPFNRHKHMGPNYGKINYNQIRNHIQKLELELSSVLTLLRFNAALQEGHENSLEDLQKLYDAWEFQENEIMNAQNRLRSIRANLAVLEGKMALAIIDTQKVVEKKQKRIDDARRALRLLRTACIVWPSFASDVQLTGSFDGWTTKLVQRKMQKSSTGIFSVYLKLYPGRYEMKFIVDGEWKIDPLRPIVHNSGYENNLLIVT